MNAVGYAFGYAVYAAVAEKCVILVCMEGRVIVSVAKRMILYISDERILNGSREKLCVMVFCKKYGMKHALSVWLCWKGYRTQTNT